MLPWHGHTTLVSPEKSPSCSEQPRWLQRLEIAWMVAPRLTSSSGTAPTVTGVAEPSGDDDGDGRPAERPGSYRYLIMPVRLPG